MELKRFHDDGNKKSYLMILLKTFFHDDDKEILNGDTKKVTKYTLFFC